MKPKPGSLGERANALLAEWRAAFGRYPQVSREPGAIFLESNRVFRKTYSNEGNMRLLLERYDYTKDRTIGKLYMDGTFFCWTLEEAIPSRAGVLFLNSEIAISSGTYQVTVTASPAVERGKLWSPTPPLLPLLWNVPDREGIRIHSGNKAVGPDEVDHTEGCILVGDIRAEDEIYQSRQALTRLMALLTMPCWITITEAASEQAKEAEEAKEETSSTA